MRTVDCNEPWKENPQFMIYSLLSCQQELAFFSTFSVLKKHLLSLKPGTCCLAQPMLPLWELEKIIQCNHKENKYIFFRLHSCCNTNPDGLILQQANSPLHQLAILGRENVVLSQTESWEGKQMHWGVNTYLAANSNWSKNPQVHSRSLHYTMFFISIQWHSLGRNNKLMEGMA